MKHIASRDNPLFKALRRLGQPGQARREGLCLLEGVHLCEAYLQWAGVPRHALFDARRLDETGRPTGELGALYDNVPPAQRLSLAGPLMEALQSVQAGQGVLFAVETPAPALPARVTETCMLLDRVQDPGNVGSILRSCAAAGVGTVFLSPETAHAWSPKVLRAGQGAHFSLVIHEQVDLDALLPALAVPLVATTLADAVSLFDADLPARCAWVMGHEGQGVRASLQAQAALRVHIPQEPRAESLNVAAAAAICLFEQRRRRH